MDLLWMRNGRGCYRLIKPYYGWPQGYRLIDLWPYALSLWWKYFFLGPYVMEDNLGHLHKFESALDALRYKQNAVELE